MPESESEHPSIAAFVRILEQAAEEFHKASDPVVKAAALERWTKAFKELAQSSEAKRAATA
jgi:hypothetical protein